MCVKASFFKGRHVFISGPMTGIEHNNVKAFSEAHAMLRENGATVVFNPAIEWLTELIGYEHLHTYCMRKCIAELVSNSEIGCNRYDTILMLEGWDESEGATLENMVAEACGMKVVLMSEVDLGE